MSNKPNIKKNAKVADIADKFMDKRAAMNDELVEQPEQPADPVQESEPRQVSLSGQTIQLLLGATGEAHLRLKEAAREVMEALEECRRANAPLHVLASLSGSLNKYATSAQRCELAIDAVKKEVSPQ